LSLIIVEFIPELFALNRINSSRFKMQAAAKKQVGITSAIALENL